MTYLNRLSMLACCFAGAMLAPALVEGQSTQQEDELARRRRATWFSDSRSFRVGDLIMVVVDERVSASERSSRVAQGQRQQTADGGLSGDGLGLSALGLDFNSGMKRNSRDIGETNREGDLTAFLSVRIVGMDANGNLEIEGQRSVKVDGRTQAITLTGVVRSEDVSASNHILSSRIADAEISYEGKSIAPRTGILGKILSILWP